MPAGPAIGIPGGTGMGTGTGNVTSETTSPSGGAASQPASESGSGRLAGGSEDLSAVIRPARARSAGRPRTTRRATGRRPATRAVAATTATRSPTTTTRTPARRVTPRAAATIRGTRAPAPPTTYHPSRTRPPTTTAREQATAITRAPARRRVSRASASKTEELDFSNEGTTFVAGGGDATQRADGTARVENPDGSVDQVDSHGTNIYHSDTTQYVDNDAGGYSNLTLSSEQAAARLEQKLVRGGGDPVNPDAVESGYVIDIPDQGTMEYRTPDAASTEGTGTITRAPAPKDPVRPEDAQGPLGFTGNPNDPSIYSMGTGGDVAAFQSTSAPGALASPDARATGFGSDSLSPVGHGSGDGDSGGDQAQSSQYAATAASSGDSSPSQTSSTGGFAPAGAGGQIYGLEGAAEGAGGDTGAGAEASGAAGAGSAGGAAGAASAGSGSGAGAAGEAATDASGAAAGAAGAGSAAGAAGPTAGDAAGAASSVASGAASGGAAGGGSAAAAGASTEDGSSGAASSAKAGAAGVVGGGSAAGAAGSTSRASSSPTSGGATSVGTWGATGGGAAADAGATTASDTYALPATGANEAAAGTEGTGSGLAAYDGSASGTTQLGSGDTTVSSAYASTSVPGKEAIFAREAAADTSAKDGPDTYHYAPPTDEGPEESKLGNADLAASGAGLSAARGASVTDPDPSGDRVVAGSGANLAGHIDAAHAQAGASIEMESAKLSTQDRPSTTGAADPIRADEASTASPSARAETRAGAAATPVDVVTGVSMGKLEAAADEVTLPTPSHTADNSGANDARPSQREPASHDGSPASGDAVSVADPGASTDAAREGAGGAPPVDIVTGSTPVKHVAAKADEIATADHPKPADGGDGGDAGRNDGSKDDDLGRHAKHDQDDDDGGHAKHDQDDDDGRHAKHDKDDDDGGTINLDAVHHSHHGHALAVDLDAPPDDGGGHDDGDADGHDATIDDAPDDGGGDAGSDSDDSG